MKNSAYNKSRSRSCQGTWSCEAAEPQCHPLFIHIKLQYMAKRNEDTTVYVLVVHLIPDSVFSVSSTLPSCGAWLWGFVFIKLQEHYVSLSLTLGKKRWDAVHFKGLRSWLSAEHLASSYSILDKSCLHEAV